MDAKWIADYTCTASNALTVEWFVSPLEYSWPDGRHQADQAFRAPSSQGPAFDRLLAPALYKSAMAFDFRAKMMVYAYMREPIAKSYGLEIEGGLCSLYGLDFRSCLAQWIYIVEGYCRQLFQVTANSNVKAVAWAIPTTGDALRDKVIGAVCIALGNYLDQVVYQSTTDGKTTRLSRHLMLHGNLRNSAFYSQKNCLSLMFVLDALVFIEMVANGNFPAVFQDRSGDTQRIAKRKGVYAYEMQQSMQEPNLQKISLMDEHV